MASPTRTPKTARGAASNIAEWLRRTPEVRAYHPNVKVNRTRAEQLRRPHNITILTGSDLAEWDSSLASASAVVIYEGGPDGWTTVGTHGNGWQGVSEAEYRGHLDLGPVWAEAVNSWCVALYPNG